jgi:hypothetical protein
MAWLLTGRTSKELRDYYSEIVFGDCGESYGWGYIAANLGRNFGAHMIIDLYAEYGPEKVYEAIDEMVLIMGREFLDQFNMTYVDSEIALMNTVELAATKPIEELPEVYVKILRLLQSWLMDQAKA